MNPFKLYHHTSLEAACSIREQGFRDGVGTYMTRHEHEGVWLTDSCDNPFQSTYSTCRITVYMMIPEAELDQFEWSEQGVGYREWLIAAEILNELVSGLEITGTFDELEWGYYKGFSDTDIEPNDK